MAFELGYSNGSYLSQLTSQHRPITEKTARGIEAKLGLPANCLDNPEFSPGTPKAAPVREFTYAGEIEMGPRDLPVYGSFKGGFDGNEIDYHNPVETIQRPPELMGVRNACAVYVINDSMEPRYFQGEMALVHPGQPPRAGDHVAVELTNGNGMIKRLVRMTSDFVELAQYNPPEKQKIRRSEIAGVYKIIGTRS